MLGVGPCRAKVIQSASESLDIRSDAEVVRILVAASHERRRHWCCAGLARYGFRVAEASDGLECLEAMRR